MNWACNFIVGLVFPYLQESLGAFSFVPFAVVLLMTIIFVIIFLPETKGTTPEELRDEIVRSLSVFLAMSNDTTNDGYSSSAGNPIDVEWRRAMDDLRRQEELDMLRGTYSEYHSSNVIRICIFLTLLIVRHLSRRLWISTH
jgi:SP family facilitated glucose transporter-like MFS transporter 3